MSEERHYLVRKGGYYYRPNSQGYTANLDEAGRYTFEEAWRESHPNGKTGPRDGIEMIHERELPPTTLATAQAEAEALKAEVARYAQALVNHNDVLRSAYQIAARKGEQTEWEGFTLRAGGVLHFHHEEVEQARAAIGSEQP